MRASVRAWAAIFAMVLIVVVIVIIVIILTWSWYLGSMPTLWRVVIRIYHLVCLVIIDFAGTFAGQLW